MTSIYPSIQSTGRYQIGNVDDTARFSTESLDEAVAYVMGTPVMTLRRAHHYGTLILIFDQGGRPCQGYNYRPHTNSYWPSPVIKI